MKQLLFSLCTFCAVGLLSASAEVDENIWRQLDSEEVPLRTQARKHIEALPIKTWLNRALNEHRSWAALEAMAAVCHKLPRKEFIKVGPHLCEQMMTLRLESMSVAQLIVAIDLSRVLLKKMEPAGGDQRAQLIDVWTSVAANAQLPAQVRPQLQELVQWMQAAQPGYIK